MNAKLFAIVWLISNTALANGNSTNNSSLVARENPENKAIAGISLIRMNNGAADSAAAIPTQNNTLLLFSDANHKKNVTPKETERKSLLGLNIAFQVPTPFMTAGTGIKLRHTQHSTVFAPSPLNSLQYEARTTEVRGALGALLFDELSVGIEPILVFGNELISQSNPSQKIESLSFRGSTGRISAQLHLKSVALAASWQKELLATVERGLVPREGSELGVPYFPGEYRVGAGYSLPALGTEMFPFQINILAEAGILYFTKAEQGLVRAGSRVYQRGYALYVPFDESPEQSVQNLKTESATTPRTAIEATLFNIPATKVQASIGTYTEPNLLTNENEKVHVTSGITLQLWNLRITGAMDSVDGNSTYALGVGAQYEK
jgi:hypothetical protein